MRHLRQLAALAVCVTVSPGAYAQLAQVAIELRPQVTVPHGHVVLGDIAYVRTTDLSTIRRLVALPIGRAPRTDTEVVVQRDTIARWVSSRLGLGADQVIWQGAPEARVTRKSQQVVGARLEQAAQAALQQWLGTRVSRFDLQVRETLRDVSVPAGDVALKVRSIPQDAQPASTMAVWLDVSVDGHIVSTIPVHFVVHAWRDVWVAVTPIASGAGIGAVAIAKKEVDLASMSAVAAVPLDAAALAADRLGAVRSLRAGEVLSSRNAAPLPTVARGDRVELHMKSGDIAMQASGEALESGELGQTVKIRWGKSSASVSGRVVAPGRVEAQL